MAGARLGRAGASGRQRRAETWLRRYAPAELLALIGALAGYLVLEVATDNGAAAAYGAALGDNLACYGLLFAREVTARSGGVSAGRPASRLVVGTRSLRALAVEFGPAEALDTAVVRPACTALAIAALGPVAGVFAAKLVADLVFYVPVIAAYELRTRWGDRIEAKREPERALGFSEQDQRQLHQSPGWPAPPRR